MKEILSTKSSRYVVPVDNGDIGFSCDSSTNSVLTRSIMTNSNNDENVNVQPGTRFLQSSSQINDEIVESNTMDAKPADCSPCTSSVMTPSKGMDIGPDLEPSQSQPIFSSGQGNDNRNELNKSSNAYEVSSISPSQNFSLPPGEQLLTLKDCKLGNVVETQNLTGVANPTVIKPLDSSSNYDEITMRSSSSTEVFQKVASPSKMTQDDGHKPNDNVFEESKLTRSSKSNSGHCLNLITGMNSKSTRSGWGPRASLPGLGLRGGADTMTNGTSGWGPPPASGAQNGGNGTSGWGSAPPPAPSASAAWGTPGDDVPQSNKASAGVVGSKPVGQAPTSTSPSVAPPSSTPAAIASSIASSSATQSTAPSASTSWAAAAGKGLPAAGTQNANGSSFGNSSSSKQLEQLNTVREALFSQDGWGGAHVKQDTSWDFDPKAANGPETQPPPPNGPGPEFMGGRPGHKNDGTDLWKMTLSGQAPVSKAQPSNPWGSHTPQNPTNYGVWGDDDENQGTGPANNEEIWNADSSNNQFGAKPSTGGGGGGGWRGDSGRSSGWNDSSSTRLEMGRDNVIGNHSVGGWGASSQRQSGGSGGWDNGPSRGGWGIDSDSPTLARRPPATMVDDPTGTSVWGKGSSSSGINPGNSNFQDMPMPRGGQMRPPGPLGPSRTMMSNVGPKEPWGQAPPNTSSKGWGDEPLPKSGGTGWGDDVVKRDPISWGNNEINAASQWNKPPRSVMPQQTNIRTSPNSWDDIAPTGAADGWMKPDLNKSKDIIWNSKQFRILCEMGFRKDEVEATLRATNLRLEDALELLNSNRRIPGSHLDNAFDSGLETGRGNFGVGPFNSHESQPGLGSISSLHGGPGGLGLNPGLPPHKPMPNNVMMAPAAANMVHPQHQRQPPSQTPTQQQIRILVQQIQMAVQAGHLNPQILNQPLAPQTLILLNQLLQQIKQLQQLQQQHSLAPRGSASNQALMNVSVSITKTKQHIQNLQNQISAQQANFLKSTPQTQGGQHHIQSSMPDSTSTVQEMFNGLSLMGSDSPLTGNGSRLAQWKLSKDFPKAPGSGAAKQQNASSGNLLLDNGPWGRGNESTGGWPDSNKGNVDSDFGIPEFEPGKPWKGTGLKNPDDDPTLTPGSVSGLSLPKASSTVNLASSSGGTDSTWATGGKGDIGNKGSGWGMSNGPNVSNSLTQIGQDLWGSGSKPSSGRAPPGLSNSSNSSSSSAWPSSSTSNGWSSGNDSNTSSSGSAWLLLKNLTPQIDGSTLKTLCMQHGPLQHFDLYLSRSIALVQYGSSGEAFKAQKALNNCLLGNTTIHASVTSENEVTSILRELGSRGNASATNGNAGAANNGSSTPTRGSTPSSLLSSMKSGGNDMWSDSVSTSKGVNAPVSSIGSSLLTNASVWGNPDTPSSLHSYLPNDLVDNI